MNRRSGFERVEQPTERLEGRHWVRRLGNKGLVCSYFVPLSAAIPLPTDHTALVPGPRLGRREGQPGRGRKESLGELQCLLLPSLASTLQYRATGRRNTIILFVSSWALEYLKHLVGTFKRLGGFPLGRSVDRDFGNWI